MAENLEGQGHGYRIDGSHDQNCTTLIFVNDVLTDYCIWDPLIEELSNRLESSSGLTFLRADLLKWNAYASSNGSSEIKPSLSDLSHGLDSLLSSIQAAKGRAHIIGLAFGASVALDLLSREPEVAASFTGISLSIPNSQSAINALVQQWMDRVALARKWGMQVTADKAVSRWLLPDQRGSKEWRRVREIVVNTTVQEMTSLTPAIIESFGSHMDNDGSVRFPLDSLGSLKKLSVRSLFLAAVVMASCQRRWQSIRS